MWWWWKVWKSVPDGGEVRVGLRGNQTCCQLILLQEHSVGHTQLGKVVLGLAAEAANVFINILYIISISLYFLSVECKPCQTCSSSTIFCLIIWSLSFSLCLFVCFSFLLLPTLAQCNARVCFILLLLPSLAPCEGLETEQFSSFSLVSTRRSSGYVWGGQLAAGKLKVGCCWV